MTHLTEDQKIDRLVAVAWPGYNTSEAFRAHRARMKRVIAEMKAIEAEEAKWSALERTHTFNKDIGAWVQNR